MNRPIIILIMVQMWTSLHALSSFSSRNNNKDQQDRRLLSFGKLVSLKNDFTMMRSSEEEDQDEEFLRRTFVKSAHRRMIQESDVFHGFMGVELDRIIMSTIDLVRDDLTLLTPEERNLQDSGNTTECTFQNAINGQCTIDEYCTRTFDTSGLVSSCSGSLVDNWILNFSTPELCFYASTGYGASDATSYNASLYSKLTDFCAIQSYEYAITTNATSGRFIYNAQSKLFEMTRPVRASYTEQSDLVTCDTLRFQVVGGNCAVCDSFSVSGSPCNSCGSCPGVAVGYNFINCTNIHPTLVQSCQGPDTFLEKLAEYLGVGCNFNQLTTGICTLESFCKANFVFKGVNFTCTGDASGEWEASGLALNELCVYDRSPYLDDDYSGPFNSSIFNPLTDYCGYFDVVYKFMNATALSETTTYRLTKPGNATLQEFNKFGRCNNTKPYPDLAVTGQPFCYAQPCSQFILQGQTCSGACISCGNGTHAVDCSNVNSLLVENCISNNDDFVDTTARFLVNHTLTQDVISSSKPTTSASPNTTTAGVDKPVMSPVATIPTTNSSPVSAPTSVSIPKVKGTSGSIVHAFSIFCNCLLAWSTYGLLY